VCLPLLIFPCTTKSRSSLLAPAHPRGPGKRFVKRLWLWWFIGQTYIVQLYFSLARICIRLSLSHTVVAQVVDAAVETVCDETVQSDIALKLANVTDECQVLLHSRTHRLGFGIFCSQPVSPCPAWSMCTSA